MKISGIYQIQSLCKPERAYVGSSVNIAHRWKEHLRDLNSGKHHSAKLQRHFDKYGMSDLMFIVSETCTPELLIIKEQTYFSPLPYFNCCPTAGSNLGFKHSEETKKKQSEAHRNISDETRMKMSIAHKGKSVNKGRVQGEEERKSRGRKGRVGWSKGLKNIFSPEVLKVMSEKAKARVFSEEHKRKISEALIGNTRAKGIKRSEETRRKMSLAQMGNKKGLGKIPWNKKIKEEEEDGND